MNFIPSAMRCDSDQKEEEYWNNINYAAEHGDKILNIFL